MLLITPKDWFDSTEIGLYFAFFLALFVLFLPIDWLLIFVLELVLFIGSYYLLRRIKTHKSTSIIISKENNWVLEMDKQHCQVEIKDYWILRGYLFIWLKGKNKSLSIIVSRSIIGERHFSQIRTKIT